MTAGKPDVTVVDAAAAVTVTALEIVDNVTDEEGFADVVDNDDDVVTAFILFLSCLHGVESTSILSLSSSKNGNT